MKYKKNNGKYSYSAYVSIYTLNLSNFVSPSVVIVSLAKFEASVFIFTPCKRPFIFVVTTCDRRTFTKLTVLERDDPCCEAISGTDALWVYS